MVVYGRPHEAPTWTEFVLGADWKSGKSWTMLFGRLGLGFIFLWAGYEKILTELSGQMATKGFLAGTVTGPLAGVFNGLSGNWVVEILLVYGEFLIGISLIFGLATRIGSVAGALQMLLFTIALWPIADKVGDNPIVDFRVFYGLAFLMFFFLRPGRFLGVDGIVQHSRFVENHPTLERILTKIG